MEPESSGHGREGQTALPNLDRAAFHMKRKWTKCMQMALSGALDRSIFTKLGLLAQQLRTNPG
jgi:hypothetical protein